MRQTNGRIIGFPAVTKGMLNGQGSGVWSPEEQYVKKATANWPVSWYTDKGMGVDFDGTNDYLSRTSDLTGNVDGKTFTFSAWVWYDNNAISDQVYSIMAADGTTVKGYCTFGLTTNFYFLNSAGTTICNFSIANSGCLKTFNHLLVSIDLSNTSNRYVFINDINVTSSVTWSTYINDVIKFTHPVHRIGKYSGASQLYPGRLSHVYLDYTYRDLSVVQNRRKFITADKKPAPRTAIGSESVYTGIYADSRLDVSEYGVKFDGVSNYLYRNTGLISDPQSQTFTFSAWVWWDGQQTEIYGLDPDDAGTGYARFNISSSGAFNLKFYTTGGGGINVYMDGTDGKIKINCWNHVLISGNTTTINSYCNGVLDKNAWTYIFNSSYIRFDGTKFYINSIYPGASSLTTSKIAHVYFDYTYRDLSNSANRQLFLTSQGTPAPNQASLSPIIYLPMTDPNNMGLNLGTGGNFTANGTFVKATDSQPILYMPLDDPNTAGINLGYGGDFAKTGIIARSDRGPNQFNVPYSDLDGSADYLSRTTAPTGIADSGIFTFSCCFAVDSTATDLKILSFQTGASVRFSVLVGAGGQLAVYGYNASSVAVLSVFTSTGAVVAGRNYHFVVSLDLSDTNKRSFKLNGQDVSVTWGTYTNGSIDFAVTTSPAYEIGRESTSLYFNGRLGNVFFHTSYIDLSVAANLAKFVTGTGIDAKPVDLGADGSGPFGTQPLIYLPMYGNNAGKNYGSGGDFTVNSGPYTGARGPNEFWGNIIKTTSYSQSNYLSKSQTNVSRPQFSMVLFIKKLTSNFFQENPRIIYMLGDNSSSFTLGRPNGADVSFDQWKLAAYVTISGNRYYLVKNIWADDGLSYSTSISTNWMTLFLSWNGTTGTVARDNTVIPLSGTLGTFQENNHYITPSYNYDSDAFQLSQYYFTTEYIDFSQEANRLKFRDAFGNPVDLGADGSTPTGTAPAIYMRFDPANQGKNYGTGGDFTKTGTINDGGQL